jgi:phosphoglycolate phosphatase-like HAD superfamily hydrolase
MIQDSAKKWNIELPSSWIIGDSTGDIQTGKNAGLKTVLVKTGEAGADKKYKAMPDYVCGDVLEAVELILGGASEL